MDGKPPLQAVDAAQWRRTKILQTEWQIEEHINTLEARAYILMLKWRSRDTQQHACKVFHLGDSQVSIGAFLKHRSPSFVLNFLTQRAAALELAGNFQPFTCFVRTHRNPADKASQKLVWQSPCTPRTGQAEDGGESN